MVNLQEKLNYSGNVDVSSILSFIADANDKDLFHIDIVSLSEKYFYDIDELINIFIYGVKNGVFIMEWEYHCPHCGGIAKESLSLHEAEHNNHCDKCKIDFVNKLDNNIEVFFSIHPSVRKISEKIKSDYMNHVVENIRQTTNYSWNNKNTLSGIRIIQNNVFRELMGDEVLKSDQSLEIMHTIILFTDIKGSTEMYSNLGDAVAFQIVREHFKILFDVIKSHEGVPVKTIGDAVMGVFVNEQYALKAALEIQNEIKKYSEKLENNKKVILKIGIHSGSTIIVTLNGRLDYFGNSVNTAARIQSQALPGEVVISSILFESNENKKIIRKYVKKVSTNKMFLKGLNEEITLYHIDISKNNQLSTSLL